MYRRIVAARVRKAWRHVQARDHMYVVIGFADEFTYRCDLRWGRITAVTTLEDTQKLEGTLDRLAAAGVEEAHATPIEDAGVSGRAAA